MINSLIKFLSRPKTETNNPNQIDSVFDDLESGIYTIRVQYQRISNQEKEILQKLQVYYQQYNEKLERAKTTFRNKNELVADSLYQESEIFKRQIEQYKRIAKEVQETKCKLLAQENQFLLTKDELSAKRTLGEANVDISQLKAEMSEQLMFLNESDELTKFDELINEASFKSQAIEEIQGSESTFNDHMRQADVVSISLEEVIQNEKEEKIRVSKRNQQILIDQVFDRGKPTATASEKERQKHILNNNNVPVSHSEKRDRVNDFFSTTEQHLSVKSEMVTHVIDKKERVRNFFK